MNSGIYSITNTINNKIYIGSAIDFKKRWKRHIKDLLKNRHCNIHLQRAYLKYGKDVLQFNIIEEVEYKKDIIIEKENFYINKFNTKNFEFGYNISDASFGDVLTSNPNRDIIIEKISYTTKQNMAKMSVEDRKQKYGQNGSLNGMYGKTHSDEAKQRISAFNKNNQYAKGAIRTKEIKENLSRLAKERVGEKNHFYNKHHSDETKKILSEKRKGKKPTNMRSVEIYGIVYESVTEASRRLNCTPCLIIYRIKSKLEKYNNCKYL